ncbi:MAG: hypothetical protein FWG65_13295 [Turicibacter sp.]|nr:hypothetical protein [Turicibacter sp.]
MMKLVKTPFEKRLSTLKALIAKTSQEISKIESLSLNALRADSLLEYHSYYVFETSQILIDMLAYEKIELADIPIELRANEHIYTFLSQDKGRIEHTTITLFEDILSITNRINHPLYCYAWQNLLRLLVGTVEWNKRFLYDDRKNRFRGDVEEKYEKFIATIQERAEKQELFQ